MNYNGVYKVSFNYVQDCNQAPLLNPSPHRPARLVPRPYHSTRLIHLPISVHVIWANVWPFVSPIRHRVHDRKGRLGKHRTVRSKVKVIQYQNCLLRKLIPEYNKSYFSASWDKIQLPFNQCLFLADTLFLTQILKRLVGYCRRFGAQRLRARCLFGWRFSFTDLSNNFQRFYRKGILEYLVFSKRTSMSATSNEL